MKKFQLLQIFIIWIILWQEMSSGILTDTDNEVLAMRNDLSEGLSKISTSMVEPNTDTVQYSRVIETWAWQYVCQ